MARRAAALLIGFGLPLFASSASAAPAPIAKGPWITQVSPTSAVIDVEVDPPSAIAIELGDAAKRVVESKEPQALHAVPLDGLSPATRYTYVVRVGATTKLGAFTTPPRDEDETPFHFLAYGDNRTDDAAHANVVRAMTGVSSEFLVHTGDLVGNGGNLKQWQTFFDIESPLLGARPFFSAVGNHELIDGAGVAYARYFGHAAAPAAPPRPTKAEVTRPEQLARTVRWGCARFFFINGMVSYERTADRAWLESALAAADAEPGLRWRIVVTHDGPWSSGPHGGNKKLHAAKVPALLREHHVDLVVSGHDHIYDRGVGDGLPYVVTGGGGAPVYEIKKPIPQSRRAESVRHFLDFSVSRSALQMVAIRVDGSTIERCGLSKPDGMAAAADWDCDPAPAPAGPLAGGSPPRACGCDVVGRRASGAGSLAVFGLGAILARVRRRRAPLS